MVLVHVEEPDQIWDINLFLMELRILDKTLYTETHTSIYKHIQQESDLLSSVCEAQKRLYIENLIISNFFK